MRLDELQASFLSLKIKQLENWTSNRISLAKKYNTDLEK